DEGFAAHHAHLAIPLFLQLALADRLTCLRTAVVVGRRTLAGAEALHDVPAGLGLERRRHLAVLQGHDLATEFRSELVLGKPAQVAAAGLAGGVVRAFAGDVGELGAAGDAGTQGIDARLRLGVAIRALAGADQDVSRLVLGHRARALRRAVADFDQHEQLETAGAADRADDVARLHGADGAREGRRDLVEAAPAQVTTFQGVRAVRIAHRRGGEFHLLAVEQALDAVDLALSDGDLLRRRPFGQRDQDVPQTVLRAAGLGGQGGIDLAVADADPALREPLLEALHQQFVADRVAEIVERHAVLRQLLAQL